MIVHTAVVIVTTAGTPVQLPLAEACGLQVTSWKDNDPTKSGYLGQTGLNKATGERVIQPLGAGESWSLLVSESSNRISVSEYAVDADMDGTKFLVTYWEN